MPSSAGSSAKARVFDLFAFILILFPLAAGGFWVERPHLKFELTELALPTLALALLAFGLSFRSGSRWLEKSLACSLARKAFAAWKAALDARPVLTLALGSAFFSTIWAFAALRRHWALRSGAFDLGIFTNAIWNLTHGNGYLSSVKGGINLLSDHQSPVFWLLAPLFSLFPHPETLLIAQSLGLALGAFALYALGRQYAQARGGHGNWIALLPLLYWAYLPIRRANLFDFHPEVFMLPLFLGAIAGIQSRANWKKCLGWVAFLLALCAKESSGPIACGIGLAWILGAGPPEKSRVRAGLFHGLSRQLAPGLATGFAAIALGIAALIVDLKLVPAALGVRYVYGSFYAHLYQGTPTHLFAEWLRSLVGLARLKFLVATLAPLAFLPLLAPRACIAALPAYLLLFLAQGDLRLSPQFHYGIEPAIGLLWALAVVLGTRANPLATLPRLGKIPAPLWIAFWVLASFGRSEIYWIRRYEPSEHAQWLREDAARCLSSSTRLTASPFLVPQVAMRRWIQQIPDLGGLGASVHNDCVWIDHTLNPWPLTPEQLDAWENQLVQEHGYQKFFECGPTRIYQRQNFAGACMRCLPVCDSHP